ncbi:MAG: rhamnulokinase, partial [Abditibacteriota bacterium]|nr:rhamnulokinase [Abditibacteriota bacterium]
TLLCQLTADCLQRVVIAGPVEATAAGNILTQAMARGALSGIDEIRAVVRNSFAPQTFTPDAGTSARWGEAYGTFTRFTAV